MASLSEAGFFLVGNYPQKKIFSGYADLREKCSSEKMSKFHLKIMIFIKEIDKGTTKKQKISPAARKKQSKVLKLCKNILL